MEKFSQAFEADTGKILNIVINSLYSDRDIFLRELLSNASDAIQKRRFLGQTTPEILNLKDDEIEWFEDLSGEREDDIADEVSNLIESASLFYDQQIEGYE